MLVLLLAGVIPLFAQGSGQAAALQQYDAPQIVRSGQNFPVDIAADQVTGTTTSTVKTSTITSTSTSLVNRTRTTTIATTTALINRTATVKTSTTLSTTKSFTSTSFSTTTDIVNRTKTATTSSTIATTTSYVKQTATATVPTTIATTTGYVNQTATTTAPTTIATTTNYVSQTATATSSATATLSTTTTTFVTATSTTTATTSTISTVPSTSTGLLVPLFIYPTTVSTWGSIAALPAAYPNVPVIAIINPNSGPGSSQDPNYVAGVNALKASGVVTIGYVWTNYGAVSLQSVENSIDAWKSFYGVTGIFLDAMAYHTGYESYYQSIETYAKVTDGMNMVIGNPGTDTIASYVGNGGVDNIGFYEDFGTPTIAYLSSAFHTTYPKTEWSFLAHGVAALNDSFIAQASQYVSYLYVSSGPGSAPWGTIPSYLNQMAADLAKVNPSTPTRAAAPSTAPSNANPNGLNNHSKLSFVCEANCAHDFSFSLPHSQNVLISVGMTRYFTIDFTQFFGLLNRIDLTHCDLLEGIHVDLKTA